MARIFEHLNNDSLTIFCPACKCGHTINKTWQFDGNKDMPTISPSILVTWAANPNASEEFKEYRNTRVCHSYVRNGQIEFLSDCTHHLAGKIVDLPDIESLENYSFE